ncbi:MAG: bifunctional alpha,alpha-trehalose-phosphate synthase (UDP-forming)/trehalose-phosphatase [Bacteroidota bacterium]
MIIVANRLPFQVSLKKGDLSFQPGTGGLVTSIRAYVESAKDTASALPLWVGTADVPEKKFRECVKGGSVVHEGYVLHPVFLPAKTWNRYYNGFCNDTIWPLFHYFPSFARYNEEYWQEYVNANHAFCGKILALYRPGDIIWIHDYHLMLLPALLREKLPGATIGFFLHIPFPSFELFRLLPDRWRKDILNGLLGADLAGFHINNYVQYFLKSVQQLLGYDHSLRTITTPDRIVTADTFPVSIDYERWSNAFLDPRVFEQRNKVKKKLAEARIIISVDRLDYAKGIINRLKGFELFLEQNPERIRKVVYVLQVVPSRDIITQYRENKKELEGLVSRINGRFGKLDWTPVVYRYSTLDFDSLCALYMAADIALIAPLRDGMNLVAKEFVACRKDKRGVLILSETAGASVELGEAIIVNPTDRQQIADAIVRALDMPIEEQMARMNDMQKRLQHYDVVRWAEDFLSQLRQIKARQESFSVREVTPAIEQGILMKYRDSHKRIIFLDYDGTLMPFARLPNLAVPDKKLLKLLNRLAEDERNTLMLISGRDKVTLDSWFGSMPIGLVAEHGACYKLKDGEWVFSAKQCSGWKSAVLQTMQVFNDRCAGTFTEEKTLSLAWHYRNAEKELGFLRSRELITALSELSASLDFQLYEGEKVVEARARGIDKGTTAAMLMNGSNYDFILAIGDDRTDEDLFKVIPGDQFSIRVGLVPGLAKYNFRRQKDVIVFLEKLVALEDTEREGPEVQEGDERSGQADPLR